MDTSREIGGNHMSYRKLTRIVRYAENKAITTGGDTGDFTADERFDQFALNLTRGIDATVTRLSSSEWTSDFQHEG